MEALLATPQLVRAGANPERVSTSEALAGKRFVLTYFTASWCPPCRAFLPRLAGFFTRERAEALGATLIIVSSDRTEADALG
jgi:nucleoredoxin